MIGLRVILAGVMMRSNGKNVKKLNCLSIAEVVDMDVEVASNDEFMRGGGCVERNDENWLRKVGKG